MARPILMPQVGQDLTEGKITALNVKVGDKVKKGDIVAEVESEKAVFEVEAFETGTVLEIRYNVGDMGIVLEPMIMVGEESGRLEEMLVRVADVYDREVQMAVKRFLAVLEPALILSLAVFIGGIVFSILLGVMGMSELVQ